MMLKSSMTFTAHMKFEVEPSKETFRGDVHAVLEGQFMTFYMTLKLRGVDSVGIFLSFALFIYFYIDKIAIHNKKKCAFEKAYVKRRILSSSLS